MPARILLCAVFLLTACSRKTVAPPDLVPATPFANVRLDADRSGIGPCEPSICINPANPDQVVAGAILDRYYYSNDGGKTWTKGTLESPHGVFGDPVILADYAGVFYYAHLSDPSGLGWSSPRLLDRMVVQKSTDGGKTWNDGSYTGLRHPKDQDKQWLGVDPRDNTLYITWTEFDVYGSSNPTHHSRILFSRSDDQGDSWSEPLAISQYEGDCLDDDQTTEGAVPAVGPDGDLYVAWSYDEKIWFDRSADGGETWLEKDIVISDQPGGWSYDIPGLSRCNGMPVTAVDLSDGPQRGRLYVNWSDQRYGETDTDVWLAYSNDGGDTWSEPIRVNDDDTGRHQFLTWMAVDPVDGAVHIVFYDRRRHEGSRTDVFLASSYDGGQTFVNQQINTETFLPSDRIFFGDYNNISAYGGRVRPIWTQFDRGELSVWTALIDLKGQP